MNADIGLNFLVMYGGARADHHHVVLLAEPLFSFIETILM